MEVVYFSLRFMSTFNFELFGIFERMRLGLYHAHILWGALFKR